MPNASFSATLYPPTQYKEFNDSPFSTLSFAQFYLETFEDGLLDTPGVNITNNLPGGDPVGVVGPSPITDSVDGDDGSIDGFGINGHSFTSLTNQAIGNYGLTISFLPQFLGGLPTYAGLVWTDGSQNRPTIFEAFDAIGNSLGTIGPVDIGDNSFLGTTGEDRFFGIFNMGGISKMTIRDPLSVNNIEIDHLQYGVGVPNDGNIPQVPGPISVVGAATALGWSRKLRRRIKASRHFQ